MLQKLASIIIRVSGWTLVGSVPELKKAIFIAAPHTSNWDGFWLLLGKCALDLDVRFLAKHSLFWWPLGSILKFFGAMPIDRSAPASTVASLARRFAEADQLFLALAPEGTRRWQPHWKTGFYQIARAADVPIVLGFIDYRCKRMGVGITLDKHQTMGEVLTEIRTFYAPLVGRRPENASPVRFPADS